MASRHGRELAELILKLAQPARSLQRLLEACRSKQGKCLSLYLAKFLSTSLALFSASFVAWTQEESPQLRRFLITTVNFQVLLVKPRARRR